LWAILAREAPKVAQAGPTFEIQTWDEGWQGKKVANRLVKVALDVKVAPRK